VACDPRSPKLVQQINSSSDPTRHIDAERKTAYFEDGTEICYRKLISTMLLDSLAKCVNDDKLRSLSNGLFYSSTHVIGIGIRGERPEGIGAKHWVCHTPLNFSRNQTNVALQLTFLRVIVPFIVPPYFQTIRRTINLQL